MAKDIVFVLHGIGKYDKDWLSEETGAVHALKEAAKDYSFFQNHSIDSHVEFVPILYDDVFQRIMSNWASQADGLVGSIPVLPDKVADVLNFMQGLDDDEWAKTFAADVVLYWGFKLFQQRVSLRVIRQIVDKVVATATSGDFAPDYHILAHSLGTAVAQDALSHLGNETWINGLQARYAAETDPGTRAEQEAILNALADLQDAFNTSNPFSPTFFTFESVTMLSNTSGLIHANSSPETTIVRPGTASENGAYTKTYINANHVADGVSKATNFKVPPDWPLAGGLTDLSPKHFIPNNDLNGLSDIVAWIHSASHYVADPNLHLRLLTMYVNPYRPTAQDVKAVGSFKNKYKPSALAGPFKAAYDKVKGGDLDGIDDAIDAFEKIKEMLGV